MAKAKHSAKKTVSKEEISSLHTTLLKMKMSIDKEEMRKKDIGPSTINAIKEVQKKYGINPGEVFDPKKMPSFTKELFNAQFLSNKTRTEKLQDLLVRAGQTIAPDEKNKRITGATTLAALQKFQKENKLPADGKVSDDVLNKLHEVAITKMLSAKTQVGNIQNTVLRAVRVGKLGVAISPDEIKNKTIGDTTTAAIKAFQEKYKLTATGTIDKATLDKLQSVAASKGVAQKILKAPAAVELKTVSANLRLNMTSPRVAEMQKVLSHLGYKIDDKEFKTQTFGKTTRSAVLAFQKSKGLAETGHVEADTLKVLNGSILEVNPSADATAFKYRVRGSVRDEAWQRKPNMVVRVYEKLLNGESAQPLVTKKNLPNGFFDITYSPPIDPITKKPKENYHVVVKLYEPVDNNPANDKLISSQIHYNVNRIHWVNFTQGQTQYLGDSDFATKRNVLQKAIGTTKIEDLQETENNKQVTQLSLQTGLSTDDIMRLILSYRVAIVINKPNPLTQEVFYAFIRQNLPPGLPGDLLRGASDWETIDQLTEIASSGIVFTDETVQQQTIDNALAQNLVSQAVKINRDAILQALKGLLSTFTLEKPILIGNGNLQSLLKSSTITAQNYPVVADVFIANKGINPGFWTDLDTKSNVIGANAITDFSTTVEVGNITKNHIPTVQFLKNNIAADGSKKFKKASDIAKLDQPGLVALINQNNKQVPDNIPGTTADEKVANYAAALKTRAETLYPSVSLVATIKRSNTTALKKVPAIEQFIDNQPDLNFRQQNIDKYLLDKKINLDEATKQELKIVQRAHKLTTDSSAGTALVDAGLHSSMQIYYTGRDRLVNTLTAKGVDAKKASQVYEFSKMQYMQILARLIEFRPEVNFGTPQVIIPQTYSIEEVKKTIGDIPNLEVLFGSLDFCDCEECQSLYGPAAYLTDMLRFLKEHDSLEANKTVKDILFERRPDLGNIKLNCENTNTPLPYIDLVCEILENNIAPPQPNFSYQTTLSAAEIRALPQYTRNEVYSDVLAGADFPMNNSFNLWQEETRTYLNFLRVPRHELMEAFQDISNPANKTPNDVSIAAEYFGISSYEKTLITTAKATAPDQNKYWGFDTTKKTVPVSVFTDHTKLSYYETLELLLVRLVNDPASPTKSVIERPVDTCDTSVQQITNITVDKLDVAHRFIRLWRKTEWKMWEVDLLIRNPKVGNNVINGDTLVRLKQFKQLQYKLKSPTEVLLAFYNNINTEERIKPDKPDVIIQPSYITLFQNTAVTNPVDAHFALAVDRQHLASETLLLELNAGYSPVPTILSSLAITQTDFDALKPKTDNHLSLASLSVLLRYAYLAKALRLTVKDLLLLLKNTNTTDPFASVEATLDCIENFEYIKASGITLTELDYVLNYSPDSPIGLRNESLVQLIDSLRKILVTNKENIDKLHLSLADRNAILAFNADALQPMTDVQLNTALTPLKTILSAANSNFVDAAFSVEETSFIIHFPPATITNADKAKLIQNIKTLRQNLNDLLSQNNNQIKSQVASSFNIADEQAAILLANLTIAPAADKLLQILEADSLLDKNADGSFKEVNTTNYPKQFAAYILLHKVSLLISRMKIETENLEWFILHQADVKTVNFSALPVSAPVVTNDFSGWLNLYKFLDFKSKYPEPEDASVRSILDLARDATSTKPAIISEIVKLTQWNEEDMMSIDTGFKLQHAVGHLDYTNAELYNRLQKCFAQEKLTGVDASTMFNWSSVNGVPHDYDVSIQTRNAVKSKYEQQDWLQKITPLYDDIREKKRKALVDYHLESSQRTQAETVLLNGKTIPNPLYWKDSNSLFKYFLIDVEMSSCQLTSRMKQALSSVQLFVQRCFLNLENRFVQVSQDEKEDVSSPNAWSQWKWMKNYRIWEANRKIFFYPENWLEPELRDDKSPFFEELENELQQNEVTTENAEAAFLNYLQKVDEVAHLDVCGMYHQMEDLTPDEVGYEVNIVHVIARTKGSPHVYYYRTYDMNYSTWSAWEKIDVEITGEHVTPVVYNRKLHLFWLVFTEKPLKTRKVPPAKATSGPSDSPDPAKMLEIQLGWTVQKSGGWTPKKISKQKLIHPWERPYSSYNLKPYYLAKFNELYLDIYISTSKEFNDTTFYDPFQDKKVRLTSNPFNESFLPWHSSSFIFDGHVKDVKMKGLGGLFHLEISGIDINIPVGPDSYFYVHENFGEDSKDLKELEPIEYGPRLRIPNGMHFNNTRLTNNVHDAKNANQLRVLENTSTATLLSGAINKFELVITQQDLQLNTITTDHPLFYQDNQRVFFIKPEWEAILNNYGQVISQVRNYRFQPFYHPYTVLFIRELNRSGLDGLFVRKVQSQPQTFAPVNSFNFSSYLPSSQAVVDVTAQKDIVDFSFTGAYSIYNWELFFHAPLMIACRLTQNQKFEDAMYWFHYIFDPTNIDNLPTPQRYWITKPFSEYNSDDYRKQRIENILSNLSENSEQLKAWRNNPFKPHVIARYRPVAYQKNVVMKYLDNLIAWGDQLFRQDTIESINEASLLYMLAYEILGDRPQKVPNVKHEDLTFNEIEVKLDDFGNARVDVIIEDTLLPITVVPPSNGNEPIPKIDTFYFPIPNNDYLVKYWDTVEDRLFKIRNCMNIEGVVRQLPLFEPPIDPALLVKAAAAGIDLSSVLNDISAPTPRYRFKVVVQKAIEFCNEVKALGEKLLSALEKKDAEELALLRSQNEIQLLEAVKEVRKKQIDETVENIGSLNKSLTLAEEKKNYYESKEFMNDAENFAFILSNISIGLDTAISLGYILAGGLKAIPHFLLGASGFGGSPHGTAGTGGDQIGDAAKFATESVAQITKTLDKMASLQTTMANYQRRKEEWDFQGRLATIETSQIQFQINSAEIRQAIAERELENQELQIENAKAVDDYMRNKFTNQQLFSWMVTQISSVYFQAYQLAFEMAKKAESCYRYELGLQTSNFVQFGYWDSLKKGLLSGDKLMTDLRRLEAAYIDQNKRELEITKHISLAQVAPFSLITLRETGTCTVSLPEWLFDMDYPGHYMRRIKNVSVSIPCIIGPYTGVNCTLSLLRNETRIDPTGAYEKTDENDPRFKVQFGAINSIATSHAQNDSGMFEMNFNDERFLPFEGLGAISDWQISLPRENNYFDFASLSDVILHINYTARNGGGLLATGANANLQTVLPNATARLLSVKSDFSTEWYRFLNPVNNADQEFVITLKPEHFPFFIRNKLNVLKIKKMDLFIESSEAGDFTANIKVTNTDVVNNLVVSQDGNFNNAHHLSRDLSANSPNALGELRMKIKLSAEPDFKSLTDDKIDNAYIFLQLGS